MAQEYTRRSFMKYAGIASLAVAGGSVLGLAGCGDSSGSNASSTASSQAQDHASTASSSSAQRSSSPTASASTAAAAAAVVFYSRTGENYQVGVIEEGNTAKVAKEIAVQTGAELIEIEPANAYPDGYDECCDVAQAEQEANERPALKETPDLSAYETIYLGYPIWWGDLPMFMYTLLESVDFAGKAIRPFNTHEGSGEAGTGKKIAAVCPDATVLEGLAIRGKVAQTEPDTVTAEVADWLAE